MGTIVGINSQTAFYSNDLWLLLFLHTVNEDALEAVSTGTVVPWAYELVVEL